MVKDQQVRRLFKLIQTQENFGIAAMKSSMDEKTARKYTRSGKLPSELKQEHTWRTRKDPLSLECEVRHQNRISRLFASRLPASKTFDNFDKKRLPTKVANHLNVLVNGSFLGRSENILAFGNPGSGKTHLLCAIGHALIEKGKQIISGIWTENMRASFW